MITEDFVADILSHVATDQQIRRAMPDGGRLFLDRRLPFLCVYRQPVGSPDSGTEQLVSTQAAYLICSGARSYRPATRELLLGLVGEGMLRFRGFLIVEVWSAAEESEPATHEESGERLLPPPSFRVCVDPRRPLGETVDALAKSLLKMRLLRQSAIVATDNTSHCGPPTLPALLTPSEIRRTGCHVLGLEVRPVYRDPLSNDVYPAVLRGLRRRMATALSQAVFAFARAHTNIRPRHYHTLGRRSLVKAVWDADRQLADIEASFDLLLQATPTNAEAAWLEFRRNRFEKPPAFRYRPVSVEQSALKRRLFQVPLERIEDATLAYLFRQKQDELDRKITMLGDVGTRRFLPGSLQVHGPADDALSALASDLLAQISNRSRRRGAKQLSAQEFALMARQEIARYQQVDPSFQPGVEVRDDIYSGLLVSHGKLLIGRKTAIPGERAEGLVQHEVGTHLVTHHNGSCQPFRQLSVGLAGYDSLQEGLAVLAEYLAGGLNRARMRLLAARVIAVKSLLENAGFIDTFRMLTHDHGFAQRTAYTITMRVFRGGGLTKDANYLRGVVEILSYLGSNGKIEPLFLGKIAADHIPLVEELRLRQILRPPPLRPRVFDFPSSTQKLAFLRSNPTPLELIEDNRR